MVARYGNSNATVDDNLRNRVAAGWRLLAGGAARRRRSVVSPSS
jgi:hypothetical protein